MVTLKELFESDDKGIDNGQILDIPEIIVEMTSQELAQTGLFIYESSW